MVYSAALPKTSATVHLIVASIAAFPVFRIISDRVSKVGYGIVGYLHNGLLSLFV